MGLSSWEKVAIVSGNDLPSSLDEVPDNGYTLCVLWAAPERCVRRLPSDELTNELIAVKQSTRNPESSRIDARVRTEEELDLIAEFSNLFLAEAGIPPRLDRCRWFFYRGVDETLPPFNEVLAEVASRHGKDESAESVLAAAQAAFEQYGVSP